MKVIPEKPELDGAALISARRRASTESSKTNVLIPEATKTEGVASAGD